MLLLKSLMAQWPTLRGKGPDNLFEDILSFLRVTDVIVPIGPAKKKKLVWIVQEEMGSRNSSKSSYILMDLCHM